MILQFGLLSCEVPIYRNFVAATLAHLQGNLLTADPETDSAQHFVLLHHVQILVLQQQFELFFGQVYDVGITNQHTEVAADKVKNLREQI